MFILIIVFKLNILTDCVIFSYTLLLLTEFAEEIDTDLKPLSITKYHALKKLQCVGNF